MEYHSDLKKPNHKIWGVIEGPFYAGDIEEDAKDMYINLCKVEIEGKIEHIEYYFQTRDDAYEMVKYFLTSIDPIEIEHDDDD
jgi:hypothetical protein|tara:strand:- start:668 stop:916 length:249 start_codon:yes stop_codon:yes gene_type:complete